MIVGAHDAPPPAAAAPTPAASGATPGGLPYPTLDDRLADTATWIGHLADAVAGRLANPGMALFAGTVTTGGDGRVWVPFPALSRCDGCVPQVLTGAGRYVIWPTVYQRSGNAALLLFRSAPVTGYTAAIAPFVGPLSVFAYAWGAPA
jgi:hypothetical protein